MQEKIPVLDIIQKCDFSAENPFDVNESLFPNLLNYLQPKLVKFIEQHVYKSWVDTGFIGENTGVVFYDLIAKKMLQDRYKGYLEHLSHQQIKDINDTFSSVIKDEARHSEIFLGILKKMNFISSYNTDFVVNSQHFAKHVTDNVSNGLYLTKHNEASLLNHVCPMIIGEAYLFACYGLFYKLSTNEDKKLIFKSLMQDESLHLNHFIGLINSARIPRLDIDEITDELHINILDHSALEIIEVVPLIKSIVKDQQKQSTILDNIYNSKHHKTFRKLYFRKIYQFYKILYPEMSESAMKTTLESYTLAEVFDRNTNNRDMLYQKNLLNQ